MCQQQIYSSKGLKSFNFYTQHQILWLLTQLMKMVDHIWDHAPSRANGLPKSVFSVHPHSEVESSQEGLLPLIRTKSVKITTENTACVFYIGHQGRARFPSLCAEPIKLWYWCVANQVVISAYYLLGIQNSTVDSLSRHFFQN